MIIYPAIDLYGGKAVRLYKGDYGKMTVYSDEPWKVAAEMAAKGADHIHIVDLEGAKNGGTPNIETVLRIKNESGAFCEIGGGIRSEEVIDKYISSGIDRVILGTAAAENAGLDCAVVGWGFRTEEELRGAWPGRIFRTAEELCDWLLEDA